MIKQTKYTRDELVKLDKQLEMIPLTFDKQFKKIFENNLELLKKFLIITLKLPITEEECNITIDSKEQTKYNHKEYQMTFDISVTLNEKTNVMVEMNSKYFKNIKERNSLYLDRKRLSLVEKGESPEDYIDTYLYQLNLNPKEKNVTHVEHIIVPYDLTTNTLFTDNKIMVLKYLEYYHKLYYTYGNREKEVIWLAGLTSKTFTETYDIYSQVLTPQELEKLMEDVINMSKDFVSVHEWEKEKMDALVEYTTQKNREEELKEAVEKEKQIAREEGLADGFAEGSLERNLEIAQNMLKENMDIQIISKITGLSKKEIENLK